MTQEDSSEWIRDHREEQQTVDHLAARVVSVIDPSLKKDTPPPRTDGVVFRKTSPLDMPRFRRRGDACVFPRGAFTLRGIILALNRAVFNERHGARSRRDHRLERSTVSERHPTEKSLGNDPRR